MRHLLQAFPSLRGGHFHITSPMTPEYNCIAWAAEDDERWWWPDINGIYYWPTSVPRAETLEAFKLAYSQLGYEECNSSDLEEGWRKVAIFADASGKPKHAARQLESGMWTSKCGEAEDIEHELTGVEGQLYGRAVCFMKRKIVVHDL
jgi:hypothetical protein